MAAAEPLQQWCRKSERLSEIRGSDRRHPKRILPTATATPAAAVRPFSSTRGGFVHRRRRRRRKGYHLHTECRPRRPQTALFLDGALARTNPAEGGAVSLIHYADRDHRHLSYAMMSHWKVESLLPLSSSIGASRFVGCSPLCNSKSKSPLLRGLRCSTS